MCIPYTADFVLMALGRVLVPKLEWFFVKNRCFLFCMDTQGTLSLSYIYTYTMLEVAHLRLSNWTLLLTASGGNLQ